MSDDFDAYHKWLGIPPKHQPPDDYRLLGIERFEDDPEVIQDAAARQISHVRTYQLGPHAQRCQEILNELAAAKVCLLDREKKVAYDAGLKAGQPDVAPVAPPLPFERTYAQPAIVRESRDEPHDEPHDERHDERHDEPGEEASDGALAEPAATPMDDEGIAYQFRHHLPQDFQPIKARQPNVESVPPPLPFEQTDATPAMVGEARDEPRDEPSGQAGDGALAEPALTGIYVGDTASWFRRRRRKDFRRIAAVIIILAAIGCAVVALAWMATVDI